jgi:hypothetical protein
MAIKEDKIPNTQPPYELDKKNYPIPSPFTLALPKAHQSINPQISSPSTIHQPINTTCTDLIPNWPHITLPKHEAEEQRITEASRTHLLAGKIAATATATADCRGM